MTNLITILIPILIAIESGGDDSALGDYKNGVPRARGCLQIWSCVVQDVNRILGTQYEHKHVHNRTIAKRICKVYLMHYGRRERLGKDATLRDLALIFHYGPNGYKIPDRHKYWEKVKGRWN